MNQPVLTIEPEDYRQMTGLKLVLLALLGACVWLNSLMGVFALEDQRLIVNNPDVRSLGLSRQAWLSGQRLATWTFALNHAVSQDRPWSYHLVNVALHVLAGLALFGLACRTLLRQADRPRWQEMAPWLAFLIALLWLAHPLQTQAVTYVANRATLLGGLFSLVALFCVVRGVDGSLSLVWYGLAVLCCALSMGSAPFTVVLPVVVLLYDRAYLASSFAEIWQRRWGLYAGLAACWALLALPFLGDSTTAASGPSALDYVLSQPAVLLHYLRLAVWPIGLCFDYADWAPAQATGDYLVPGLVVVVLLATAAYAYWRWPRVGFLALSALLFLLPASALPQADLVGEQRLYLSLAGLSGLLVVGGVALALRLEERAPLAPLVVLVVGGVLAALLGLGTFLRNTDYYTAVDLWQDTVSKRPGNVRARQNLALALFQAGKYAGSATEYRTILDTSSAPADARLPARRNLGLAVGMSGDVGAGMRILEDAWETNAERAAALNTLGALLLGKEDNAAAERCLREAVRLQPDKAAYHFNLAVVLKKAGKHPEAEKAKQAWQKLDPDFLKRQQ
jgi:protein O-mannosyl-transferase